MPTRLGAPPIETPKQPNVPLYIIVAVVVLVLGGFGIIGFIDSRAMGDQTTVVTGLLAWLAPVVLGLIAVFTTVATRQQSAQTQQQVNGTLTKLTDEVMNAKGEAEAAKMQAALLQQRLEQMKPPAPKIEVAKGPMP